MPADRRSDLPLDEWLEETIGDPNLDRDTSVVVLVDDQPAALSWIYVDERHGRADHDLTGTARSFRRRGLARLAKLAVIERAAARRGHHADDGERQRERRHAGDQRQLGFRPFAVVTEWVKPLT